MEFIPAEVGLGASLTFSRHALTFVWDFAEQNPFAAVGGNWDGAVDWIAQVDTITSASRIGQVAIADARKSPLPESSVDIWFTDPPYYDSIPYADLSDFFFVWLKRILPPEQIPLRMAGRADFRNGQRQPIRQRPVQRLLTDRLGQHRHAFVTHPFGEAQRRGGKTIQPRCSSLSSIMAVQQKGIFWRGTRPGCMASAITIVSWCLSGLLCFLKVTKIRHGKRWAALLIVGVTSKRPVHRFAQLGHCKRFVEEAIHVGIRVVFLMKLLQVGSRQNDG